MSTIYHKHHIVPRHMGGTDEPSNLIELTVEEHAEAHRKLYEQHGKEEDRIAWLTLSGQASKPEAMKLASKLGRAKTDKILEERYGPDWRCIHAKLGAAKGGQRSKELYENNSEYRERIMLGQMKGMKAASSESAKIKRKQTFEKMQFQMGVNNSNYGKMWITNIELKQYKMHPKDLPVPCGWVRGRKSFIEKKSVPTQPKKRIVRVSPRKGVKLSDETKNKMILAKSGKNNPMFGKKRIMSEEAKRKISETLRRKNLEADRRFALLTSGL